LEKGLKGRIVSAKVSKKRLAKPTRDSASKRRSPLP